MTTTRRDLLTGALLAAGTAMTPDLSHAQHRGHLHDHQAIPSDPALRVKALESLLVSKGLVDRAALDALIDTVEYMVGPRNSPRHELSIEQPDEVNAALCRHGGD